MFSLDLAEHHARDTILLITVKQHIHELVDGLRDDSPLLLEVRETLQMDQALGEALADVDAGRTLTSAEFMAKVQERWPVML